MRRLTSIALLLLASAAAEAQLIETIEVRVTNVDVVVTDRAGKPVVGLTKDDFEILENGFEQPITHFYELREGGADPQAPEVPAELQRRRVVIFIDQDSIDLRRRADAFSSFSRSIDTLLRDGDEAMVVSLYRDRRVVTPLTSDREAIRAALREAAGATVGTPQRQFARERVISEAGELLRYAQDVGAPLGGGALRQQFLTIADAYDLATAKAKNHADELLTAQKMLIRAMLGTLDSLAGLDGRKVLIFLGGDLQQRPGADLFQAVDALFRSTSVTMVGGRNTSAQFDLSAELGKLARQANESGVTLYLMDGADHSSRRDASSAAPIEGTGFVIDAGLDLETAASMSSLAAETGGRALINSIDYDFALDGIVRDLGAYYSLGYNPPGGAGERTIRVKLKKPGLVARSRRSYTLQTSDEQLTDRVVANAFHPRLSSDMPVTMELGKVEPDGDAYRVAVTVRFPGDMTTIPDGAIQAGELALYFVAANVEGRRSPVAKDVRSFKYSAIEAKNIRSKPFTYTGWVRVRAGEQLLSVAVVDRLAGRSGFARMQFRAP